MSIHGAFTPKRIEDNIKEKEDKLIEIYNTYCSKLPEIKKITDKRKINIKKFLKEFTLEQFEEICKKANTTDFLIGKNERGWKANFDFILNIDKATAILEGKYTKKREKMDDFVEMWEEAKNEEERNNTSSSTFSW